MTPGVATGMERGLGRLAVAEDAVREIAMREMRRHDEDVPARRPRLAEFG